MRQTQACHGRRIAEIRLEQGLTQIDLARMSGYSERLIRKAESGAMVTFFAIKDIAAALSVGGQTVSPGDLTCNPPQLARSFLQAFASHEQEMAGQVLHFIDEHFVLDCVGNPQSIPFAGQWQGADGLEQWARQYFEVLVRPASDFYQPELLASGDTVIAWGRDLLQTPEGQSSPIWLALKFVFNEGKLVHLEKKFDTEDMKKILRTSTDSTVSQ